VTIARNWRTVRGALACRIPSPRLPGQDGAGEGFPPNHSAIIYLTGRNVWFRVRFTLETSAAIAAHVREIL